MDRRDELKLKFSCYVLFIFFLFAPLDQVMFRYEFSESRDWDATTIVKSLRKSGHLVPLFIPQNHKLTVVYIERNVKQVDDSSSFIYSSLIEKDQFKNINVKLTKDDIFLSPARFTYLILFLFFLVSWLNPLNLREIIVNRKAHNN